MRLDDFPQGAHIVGRASGGLTRLHADTADQVIPRQSSGHVTRLNRLAPGDFQSHGLYPIGATDLSPALAELATANDQGPVTSGEQISHGRLHGAGTRGGPEDHLTQRTDEILHTLSA